MVSYAYMIAWIVAALGGADTLLTLLSQLALWQRKEYRIDRMKAYLGSPEGSLVSQWNTLLLGVLVASGSVAAFAGLSRLASILGFAGLLFHTAGHGARIFRRGVIRPALTMRIKMIAACVALATIAWVSLIASTALMPALLWATYVFIAPAVVAICVGVSHIPVSLKKRALIARARTHRAKLSALTVVGITGSVGKTSVKTYLLHLLGGPSKKVQATDKHRNSPYPVAKDMLESLSPNTSYYIAEMAAYRKGEIAQLCEILSPTVAVITAITNQHAELFGSKEVLADAKWELIDALPEDGTLVLNKDSNEIVRKAKKETRKILWYSMRDEKADVYASAIQLLPGSIACTISFQGKKHAGTLPVVGMGQLSSALAAASAAFALGKTPADIMRNIKTLPAIPRTMEQKRLESGAVVIDDSYSGSEASYLQAIEYLQATASSDARLVFVPIIELGEDAAAAHRRIGIKLKNVSARVYIYGNAHKQDILSGLGKHPTAQVSWISDPSDLAHAVSEHITDQTVIVLEGRVPDLLRDRLP